jgi:hypothetical protein
MAGSAVRARWSSWPGFETMPMSLDIGRVTQRMPTHEHVPLSKKDGGRRAVANAILAHRLCNRSDYSVRVGRSYARDLERIRKAREEATRREATVEADSQSGEPVEETERRQRQRRRSRRRRRRRRSGSPCRTTRRRSTSSTTRRSAIAPGRRSLGSRTKSATPSSVATSSVR